MRPARWLLAFALTALLLTTGVRSAHAAATLTVSENPVKIGSGQTSKMVTLTWTLDAGQKATLSVKDNAQNNVFPPVSLVSPPTSGTQPLTVQCNKSYTATLVGQGTNQNLVPPLQITVQCGGIIGPIDPCLVLDCGPDIPPFNPCLLVTCNKVTVTPDPRGTFANFKVTAEKASSFLLEVGKQAPVNGQLPVVEKVIFSVGKTLSWDTHIVGLDDNTHYFYVATATDEQGKKSGTTGSFDTLKRVVTVSFTSIAMFDDSDEDFIFEDDCECTFGFWLNGSAITQWSHDDFGDGETKNPGVTHTIKPAADTLTIKVAGWDDDNIVGGPDFCSWESNPSACGDDFAQAQNSYTVDISDFDGPIPAKNFLLTANGSSLIFTVSGTYTISYAK